MIGAKILFLVIVLAFVIGQGRLMLRSYQSGAAGFGRLAAQRGDNELLYWVWMGAYTVALVYGLLFLVSALIAFGL